MAKTHLVTGGSGFLGNLIARRLLEQGERVRILDILDTPGRPPEIEFNNCDILDRDSVAKAMKGVSVVHHTVALVPLTKSGKRFAEVNRDGTRVAAEEAAKAGVDALIHVSSSAVYGKPVCPVTNDSPIAPVEIYGRAKAEGEREARAVCSREKLPLIVIRPRTLLGEGRLGIFQVLFEWMRENRKIYILGNGKNRLQFLHAHDMMDFYMLALATQQTGDFNVGTEKFGTLREDLTGLIASVGSRSRVVGIPAAPAVGILRILDLFGLSPLAGWHYLTYQYSNYYDISPLLAMGWRPRYSNYDMMFESYRWFEDNLDNLRATKLVSAHRSPVREGILSLLRRIS